MNKSTIDDIYDLENTRKNIKFDEVDLEHDSYLIQLIFNYDFDTNKVYEVFNLKYPKKYKKSQILERLTVLIDSVNDVQEINEEVTTTIQPSKPSVKIETDDYNPISKIETFDEYKPGAKIETFDDKPYKNEFVLNEIDNHTKDEFDEFDDVKDENMNNELNLDKISEGSLHSQEYNMPSQHNQQNQPKVTKPKININDILIDLELMKKCGFKIPNESFGTQEHTYELQNIEFEEDLSADFILDQANSILAHAQAFESKTDEFDLIDTMFKPKKKVDHEYVDKIKGKVADIDPYSIKLGEYESILKTSTDVKLVESSLGESKDNPQVESPNKLTQEQLNAEYREKSAKRSKEEQAAFEVWLKSQEKVNLNHQEQKEREEEEFYEYEFRRFESAIEGNEFLSEHRMFRRDTCKLPPLSYVPMNVYNSQIIRAEEEGEVDWRYKSVFCVEYISNSVVQKIIWWLYFDLVKCTSFIKTRLRKPFARCNYKSTNPALETDCIIMLMNANTDAISYILENMEITNLFFGQELQDIYKLKYDANMLSDIVVNIDYAMDEMMTRVEPIELFVRYPESIVYDWQSQNKLQFYKNQLEMSLMVLKTVHLKQEEFNEIYDFINVSGLSLIGFYTVFMDLEEQRRFKSLFNDYIFHFSDELTFSHHEYEKTGVPMIVFVVAGFNAQGKVSSFIFKLRKKYTQFVKDDVVFTKSKGPKSNNYNLELNYFCGGRIIRDTVNYPSSHKFYTLTVPYFSKAYIVLGVEFPRAKLGYILTKLTENSIYLENIHMVDSDCLDGRFVKEYLRDYNSQFSFNIMVRNKIWKTYNKNIIVLEVSGFDMSNKQKFIETMLDFDVDHVHKQTHYYESALTNYALSPLYFISKEEYNLTKFLQYNLIYLHKERNVTSFAKIISKYYTDESEDTKINKYSFESYVRMHSQDQKERPDLYVAVCDFEDFDSYYNKSEKLNMFNFILFTLFDMYSLPEKMYNSYLSTTYDRNNMNVASELLYVAKVRGSQILHYRKSHTFSIEVNSNLDYFLLFYRSQHTPKQIMETLKAVNWEVIQEGKHHDSIRYCDIVSNTETVLEYFKLFTRMDDIHDDPHFYYNFNYENLELSDNVQNYMVLKDYNSFTFNKATIQNPAFLVFWLKDQNYGKYILKYIKKLQNENIDFTYLAIEDIQISKLDSMNKNAKRYFTFYQTANVSVMREFKEMFVNGKCLVAMVKGYNVYKALAKHIGIWFSELSELNKDNQNCLLYELSQSYLQKQAYHFYYSLDKIGYDRESQGVEKYIFKRDLRYKWALFNKEEQDDDEFKYRVNIVSLKTINAQYNQVKSLIQEMLRLNVIHFQTYTFDKAYNNSPLIEKLNRLVDMREFFEEKGSYLVILYYDEKKRCESLYSGVKDVFSTVKERVQIERILMYFVEKCIHKDFEAVEIKKN